MKILIASYFFYPENVPRAFRTFELVKEFSRQGNEVEVLIPENDFDYSELDKRYKFKTIKIKEGFFLNKRNKKNTEAIVHFVKKKTLKSDLNKLLYYFFGEKKIEYGINLKNFLLNEKNKYDMVISISYPIYVHYGIASALKKKKDLAIISIADCGDPFYYHEKKKLAFYFKYFEKRIFDKFDYITVPVESAIKSYITFKSIDKIKVIPQGFDFSQIRLANYKKNKIPVFGYAGAFIENQRDPKILFDYLLKADFDFKFLVYLVKPESSLRLIEKYIDKLNVKVIIKQSIPREEVLFEFSKCDFLINVENMTSNQSPSKLIDYTLTKRPIFSFHPERFDEKTFNNFINGDYTKQLTIDIDQYEIKKIAERFLSLKNINF